MVTSIILALETIGFSTAAATFAVNFAVSMIVTRVFGQSQQGPQDNGTRQQVPPSNVNAIPIVYGDAYLGGTFVDAVLTTNQKTMYYVMAVSCISPNGQFTFDTTKFYYGDRLITFDGTDQTKVVSLTDEAGNVDTKISGNLYINLYKSSASGTITSLNGASAPNVVMGGSDIDVSLRWPSSGRQMNGLAFAIVKLNYNADAGTTSLSPITFHASQYLNGAGVAKPGDVWYDYITNDQYGGAVDSAFVDSTSVTSLNTYSDEVITFETYTGSPSTQPRYRINGVIDAGQTVLSNLDKIMTCCDSWMAYNAALGQWSIVINKAESATYAFNDNNIIGDIRVSATDITQSINQVEAKFPNKNNRDQPDYVNLATPSGLLYPNEPVNKYSATYDLVNESVQSQYLANRILEQAREDLIVSFNTTYYGIQVDAGAVVSVTNSDYGWTNKLFRVVKVNEASLPDGTLGARLEMSEYSAGVYDDFNITQYTPVPNSSLPSVSYFSPLSAPTVSASNPSSAIPNFNVSITIPATGRVTYSELYYTTAAIPTSSDWKLLSTASTIDGTPVTPSTTYVFANQVLPTGASTSATYYFSYVVGNDIAKSTRSSISASFTWTPIQPTGPTGPTGASITGPTGATGATGSSGTSGVNGLTFINAYKVQSQSASTPTFTTPTTGSALPTGWSATAPSVSVGQVMWYIQGRYNSNASTTIDGVAPNTTAWTGPIAASIFQDIESDNWNGSVPPVASNIASWGTTGYYISRTNGGMFANAFYARGVVKVDGSDTLSSYGYTSIDANGSGGADFGGVFYSNNAYGFGLVGWTDSGTTYSGLYGYSSNNASYGVYAAHGGTGTALYVAGKMQITSTVLVSNLNADLLDGNHASAFLGAGDTATNSDRVDGYHAGNSSGQVPVSNGTVNTNLNADLLDGKNATDLVNIASGTTNGKYIYYVNNTGAPSNPTTRAAWILISTNDGATVYLPGYV